MNQESPASVPLDATAGRQLLLDDHLLAQSTLVREWATPVQHPLNPILRPETQRDLNGSRCPVAAPFDDGIVCDPETGQWRVWYMSGWFDRTATRTSPDGIDWHSSDPEELKGIDYERDGHIIQRDGSSICHDPTDGGYKMFRWVRERTASFTPDDLPRHDTPTIWEGGETYSSRDGRHWQFEGRTGPCGDNTTFFYDPYRGHWTFSLRTHLGPFGRGRGWHSGPSLADASSWREEDVLPWVGSHGFGTGTTIGDLPTAQIYKVNCVAYESAMLGVFAVYRGPSNDYAEAHGTVKVIDLYLGISRDGYHFTVAPQPLLSSSQQPGAWDAGYLHMVNGGILPVGEQTRIYYTGFSGLSPRFGHHMYAGGSMGFATLRRDGFCSLTSGPRGEGHAKSRQLNVDGKVFYLNAETRTGSIAINITNLESGKIDSHIVRAGTDSTQLALSLSESSSCRKTVEIDFHLTGDAHVYSFWVG